MIRALMLAVLVVESISSTSAHLIDAAPTKRAKRIVYGRNLYSHKYFSTEYFVEIRHNYECIVKHDKHKDLLKSCNGNHECSATLIHPQYVITAAHCLMYAEIRVFDEPQPESFWDPIVEAWEDSARAIKAAFIFPKPKHTMNSDWSLLAGGTSLGTMTQLRHVFNIFPHPDWPKARKINVKGSDLDSSLSHDILLIKACEPFNIDEKVKPVVLDVKSKMKEHYEQIVKLGLVCLYLGMGGKEEGDYNLYSRIPWNKPYTQWAQYTWSQSSCYSACGYAGSHDTEHTCKLCSTPFGPSTAHALKLDSGSPVLCNGKMVGVVNYSGLSNPERNYTTSTSYAIYCSRNMITKQRLEYYSKQSSKQYHPSSEYRKLRRVADIQRVLK